MSETATYPVILIPGLIGYGEDKAVLNKTVPYFGLLAGDAAGAVRSTGRDAHVASFRPLAGIWERTCELYAQIKGGTVDYGAAYSAKMKIARYGAEYPGWVPDFGTDGISVDLIAHGFGAPVARLLAALLAYGSVTEQEAGYDYSPLFEGGHSGAVHSITTLAGIHDGTTLFQAVDNFVPAVTKTVVKQGLKKQAKESNKDAGTLAEEYLARTDGNVFYEAGLDGMAAFNKAMKMDPNTYYLAYTGEVTEDKTDAVKSKIPDIVADMLDIDKGKYRSPFAPRRREFVSIKDLVFPTKKAGVLAPTSMLISAFQNHLPEEAIVDPAAKPNDGLVNTNGSLAPSTESVTGFRYADECVPGVWYQMPIENRNHLSFIGLGVKPDAYRNEVLDLIDLLNELPELEIE